METRRFRGVGLALLVLALLVPGRAFAITGTTDEIVVENGTVGLAIPLIVTKGGTGQPTLTAEAVLVGDGTNPVQMETGTNGQVFRMAGGVVAFGSIDLADSAAVGASILALDNGGTGLSNAAPTASTFLVGTGAALEYTTALTDCEAANEAVTYDDTNRDFGCHTISASGTTGILAFSTNMDITASSTIHMAPGVSDTTQARAQTIAAVGMTLDNLNCVASAAPGGTGITITMADGACSGALSDSATQTCTIASGARTCAEAGAGEAVTAGNCYGFHADSTASANAVVVSCNIERAS